MSQTPINNSSLSPYSMSKGTLLTNIEDLPSWNSSSLGSNRSSINSQNIDSDGAVSESTPTGKTIIRPLRNLSDSVNIMFQYLYS